MSLIADSDQRRDPYLELIHRFPLKPIRCDKEMTEAHQVVNSLLDREDLCSEERDYLEILARLVEEYEDRAYPMDAVSEADALEHLIDAKGVSQTCVAEGTGIALSTISEVLASKRNLTLADVRALAEYFDVDPGVFI